MLKLCLSVLLFTAFFLPVSAQSPLSANSEKIVDAQGHEVQLTGVNLGVWFLIEPYMTSEREAKSQWQMKRKMVAQGASSKEVDSFFVSWRDLYIQQADIDHIASLGFNNIRLPLHYELFLTPHQRDELNKAALDSTKVVGFTDSLERWQKTGQLFADQNTEGFRRIDSVISWCRPNGIYITLDLHAAPGGQGTQLSINDALLAKQFWRGKHAWFFQQATTLFWQKVSMRYKSEPLIAMYDLLNEPNHVIYIPKLRRFYRRTLEAIRGNGDKHLVLLEGGLWGVTYMMMRPQFYRSIHIDNIVYNIHDYSGWREPKNKRGESLLKTRYRVVPFILTDEIVGGRFRKKNHVPIYVGEFGEKDPAWLSKKIKAYNEMKISWSFWSYKQIAYDQTRCGSGVVCIQSIDLYSREGRARCIAALKKRDLIFNQPNIDALTGKPISK